MSLLEMKNIKKSFNGVEVLKDISLKVFFEVLIQTFNSILCFCDNALKDLHVSAINSVMSP